jgi:hypothetical protein
MQLHITMPVWIISSQQTDGKSLVVTAEGQKEETIHKCFLIFSARHEAEAYRDAAVPDGEVFEAPHETVLADYLEGLHAKQQINYVGIDPPIPDGGAFDTPTADINDLISWLRRNV